MLLLRDVSVTCLQHVTLQVDAGERVALIGRAGTGKTSLLKCAAGLLAPTHGEVVRPPGTIGMAFARDALYDHCTVFDNVAFVLRRMGVADLEDRVLSMLAAVGLASDRDKFPRQLSGGMQKRVGIARALVRAPKLALFDDPTAGLDPITSTNILALIADLTAAERGVTLIASSDVPRVLPFVHRVALVDQGIVFDGPARTACEHPRVAAFLGRGLPE
jgi:phospholipid/cholesterol/gamma-HCH transport system ATP-binding protein